MSKDQGPLLTDKESFERCINSDLNGLNGLKDAIRRGDYRSCRAIFAQYIQRTLNPELFCLDSIPQTSCGFHSFVV